MDELTPDELYQADMDVAVRNIEATAAYWEKRCRDSETRAPGRFEVMDELHSELIERLAELEHDQWMQWARSLSESEALSPERIKRWAEFMVPYAQLPEQWKEHDRKWARRVLDVLQRPIIVEL